MKRQKYRNYLSLVYVNVCVSLFIGLAFGLTGCQTTTTPLPEPIAAQISIADIEPIF